jgi:hypothetical protein
LQQWRLHDHVGDDGGHGEGRETGLMARSGSSVARAAEEGEEGEEQEEGEEE